MKMRNFLKIEERAVKKRGLTKGDADESVVRITGKKKATVIRMISRVLAAALSFSPTGLTAAFAAPVSLQPPRDVKVLDIGYTQNVNSNDWYAELGWDTSPVDYPAGSYDKYITLGLNEVAYGTGEIKSDAMQVLLQGSDSGFGINSYTPEGIRHGTIYEAYTKASYKLDTEGGPVAVSSQKSNSAKFLTGLHVTVELVPGTNNIKIKWDDVWDTSGRIGYQILISDTKGFTQPPPIPYIAPDEIGQSGSAVTVNRDEQSLEYIYTHAQPGREYSIKVVPMPNAGVACADQEEIAAMTIKTDIILKAQRVGYNSNGDAIWKLFWNPIIKGDLFDRVDYELYRFTYDNPNGQLFRRIPDADNYLITIKKGDPVEYSFKVDAKAYIKGTGTYVLFESNTKVKLQEQIPQVPEAPDIVDAFPDADPEPLYYDELLTSGSASVLWRVPYAGDGSVDQDVTYDIYLLEDIEYVSNPPSNYKIASDLSMSGANEVRNKLTGELMGYRYDIEGLRSNSTYYFVIYAKKNYLVENPEDGLMVPMPYISKQSVKVISTKPDTGTDRPVAPSVPPFGVVPDSVTFTQATLTLDKSWDRPDGTRVNYQTGWKAMPHVVSWHDALELVRMRYKRDYLAYSDLSSPEIKAMEVPQQPFSIPDIDKDAEDQSFAFDITGLTQNTSYLVWVTIENQNGTSSDPSDPIILTTPPEIPEIPVTPVVPDDLKGIASDTFVDLFWTFVKDMDYEIKGGTSDALDSATITAQVSYEDIRQSTFTRIEGLEPNTVYYFWIKAISRGAGGETLESVYSNPLVIKTQAYSPPAPPTGFGIKSGADGVTESSITYVWNAKEGFKYYLEFAENADFDDAVTIEVSGGIHTVGNLISNHRYYARLYAFEEKTQLISEPTRTIMVATGRSRDEYDGSHDLDEKVTGDGLKIPVKLEDGIWIARSVGADAYVLSERIRAIYDPVVKIDLSEPPERTAQIWLELGSPVIDALADLGRELYVKLPWGQYMIRPGTFHTDSYFKERGNGDALAVRIEAESPASGYKPSDLMQIKTPVTELMVSYLHGGSSAHIGEIAQSIRMELPVPGLENYASEQIRTYSYSYDWYALPTFTDYDNDRVVGELDKPGPVVAAIWGVKPAAQVPFYVKSSLEKIQAVYELSSLPKKFDDKAYIKEKDILKLILDVIPAGYTDFDIRQKAVQAGLIESASDISDKFSNRDKAVDLLVSLYKFKTREKAVPVKPNVWAYYKDLNKADKRYLDSFKFALENGIVQGNGSSLVNPDKPTNYGEFIVMLERTLQLCGDIS